MHPATLQPCIDHQGIKPAASAWPLSNIMCSLWQGEAARAHAEQTAMAGCLRIFAGSRKGRLAWDRASLTGECSSSNSQRKV